MKQDSDINQLKTDLETLIHDAKKLMSGFRDTLQNEVDHKKEQLKDHIENQMNEIKSKIPTSQELKKTVGEHAKSNWVQYLTIAFVAGIVVGSVFKKDQ